MKYWYKIIMALVMVGLLWPTSLLAQEDSADQSPLFLTPQPSPSEEPPPLLKLESEYAIGRVTEIVSEESQGTGESRVQTVKVLVTRGKEKGQTIEVADYPSSTELHRLRQGDAVVVNKTTTLNQSTYYIADRYRLPPTILVAVIFFVMVVFFSRWKGFRSILGLFFSLAVLIYFVVPQILAGRSPMLISLVGALFIAVLSLYLAHGFNRRTSIALLSTLITLSIATVLSLIFVQLSRLTGIGSEDAFFLQTIPGIATIDLRGLLLGGIVIGALGVLDDITTSQVAAVAEIRQANPKLSPVELYASGIRVGQEHIASLVNTLVLAYVGASFPLFLLFTSSVNTQPLWVTLNSELIVEELVRTLVGSSALIFAVPIATFLAATFLTRTPVEVLRREEAADGHGGHHHH